ncbi:hypothetical protein GY45DRAFT_1141728 [Cubamyces sp. BRFM 1775]|nr:hypothetical protein GY45DRAFT_1141728 [Cubamyces sp. BRFM 1775]
MRGSLRVRGVFRRLRLRQHCALQSCRHTSLGLVNAWLTYPDRVDGQIRRETCAFMPPSVSAHHRLTYAYRYRRRSSNWLTQSCYNRHSCWGLRDVRVDGNCLVMSGLRGRTRRRACRIVGVHMGDRRLVGPGRPLEIRYDMHSASGLLTTKLKTYAVRVLLARPGPQVEASS